MINKITQQEYPDIWDHIIEDCYDTTKKEHRRGSNFFTNLIYEINQEFFPDHPELHGFWMSERVIWDVEYGCDDAIDKLYRVEKKKIIIEKEEWNIVT